MPTEAPWRSAAFCWRAKVRWRRLGSPRCAAAGWDRQAAPFPACWPFDLAGAWRFLLRKALLLPQED
jgi:hypothetical protein